MRKILLPLFIALATVLGCEEFLAEKPNKKLVVPTSLTDLQSMLDNASSVNIEPGEGEVAADDYYMTATTWSSLRNEEERRAYVWEPDFSTTEQRWAIAYRNVYWSNIILERLDEMDKAGSNPLEWANVKGQALFLRAKNHLAIALIWSLAYDEETASEDLGIPLRLTSNFNIASSRANLKDTYDQVINDLIAAEELLPDNPEVATRASRPAAMALLARTFLFMRDYSNTLKYADACLEIKNSLLDFNSIDPSPTYPIPRFESNPEVIYHSTMSNIPQLTVNNARIDSNLFNSYREDDLRGNLFFRPNDGGSVSFRGSFSNSSSLFFGLTTSEVLLMRAECLARLGDKDAAMLDLNRLLQHRYRDGSPSIPKHAINAEDALSQILNERRKELVFRGIRFPDVKRLNKEGSNIAFKRRLYGIEYHLGPNDLRFALSIPEEVVERGAGIDQNPR